ncbi:hypothetical protein Tco_1162334 [Tanacetum coccineum]
MTNDQANYYSGITSITVNGKNAYKLNGKFLNDFHKNAFSGTNREDAVEHIEYFLKIVNPIDLPNVNQDKLRVVVFPILLVGDAWRWFDGIKGSITSWVDLTSNDYWKLGSDEIEPINEEPSDLEETNHDDKQEIGEIFRIETILFDYETPLCEEFNEFNYLLKIDLISLLKTLKDSKLMKNLRTIGFTNGTKMCHGYTKNHGRIMDHGKNPHQLHIVANLSIIKLDVQNGQHVVGGMMDIDSKLKEEALRNKATMDGLINEDVEPNNEGWKSWDNGHEDDERCELFDNHELPVCNIRRFEMIKYSFEDDEEYVVAKEDEYEDLTSTSEDACRAYQEIFRMMDEGWMDLAERREIDDVGEESTIWKFRSVGVLKL